MTDVSKYESSAFVLYVLNYQKTRSSLFLYFFTEFIHQRSPKAQVKHSFYFLLTIGLLTLVRDASEQYVIVKSVHSRGLYTYPLRSTQ